MKSEMLNWLKDYIAYTPKSEMQQDWERVKSEDLNGPSAFDLINSWKEETGIGVCYMEDIGPPIECIVNKKKTPDFMGSFFLCKLAP